MTTPIVTLFRTLRHSPFTYALFPEVVPDSKFGQDYCDGSLVVAFFGPGRWESNVAEYDYELRISRPATAFEIGPVQRKLKRLGVVAVHRQRCLPWWRHAWWRRGEPLPPNLLRQSVAFYGVADGGSAILTAELVHFYAAPRAA